MDDQRAQTAIRRAFADRGAPALFMSELQLATAAALTTADLEAELERMVASGAFLVVRKPAPDPHLADVDLRLVAPATERAADAIERTWDAWLREFLSSHRCT